MRNLLLLRIILIAIISLYFNFVISDICLASPDRDKNTITVFVVDTSLSMVKEKALPITRVKNFMEDYVKQSEIGDRIVIMAFDESVRVLREHEITEKADKKNIIENIKNIRPVGQWTWIGRALEDLKQKTIDLKNNYPEKKLTVYFLTDGKDDPPPDSGEMRRGFRDLLIDNFNDFKQKDTYLYVLYSDPDALTSKDKEEIAKSTSITPKEIEKEAIHRFIEIEPSSIDFGTIARGAQTLKKELTIIKIMEAEGQQVNLSLSLNGSRENTQNWKSNDYGKIIASIKPKSFIVEKEHQSIELNFIFPEPLKEGIYQGSLKLTSSVDILPTEMHINFIVVEDTGKRIYVGPSKYVLGRIYLTEKQPITKELKIKKLMKTEGEMIHLKSSLSGVDISPSDILCDERGNKEIVINFDSDLAPGKRKADIIISPDNPAVIIKPQNKIEVSFVVKEPGSTDGQKQSDIGSEQWKKVLAFFIIISLLCLLWLAFLRSKTVWVKRNDTQEVNEIDVKGFSRTYINNLGLGNYYLQFKLLGLNIGQDGDSSKTTVQYEEKIECKTYDGVNVQIIISDKPL